MNSEAYLHLRTERACCLTCRRTMTRNDREDPQPRWLAAEDFCRHCARPVSADGQRAEEAAARRYAGEADGSGLRIIRPVS